MTAVFNEDSAFKHFTPSFLVALVFSNAVWPGPEYRDAIASKSKPV